MAYRKIEVLGTTYEYIVGKTHLKIKGLGAWWNSEVGKNMGDDVYSVTPAHVREKILEERARSV